MSEYELYHHGVKGMKWGVRRYQNKDGSLTPAGKKRYYDTPALRSQKADRDTAKAAMKKSERDLDKAARRYELIPTTQRRKEYEKASERYRLDADTYRHAKLKYSTNKEVARIQDKGVEFAKKSKHRLRLEEQYKKMGMDAEQAQAAANNRIRTEKFLAASAAVTVTACVAYMAYNKHKSKVDGFIKAGDWMQRVEMQNTNGKLYDIFYASNNERDNKRYATLLGAARKQATGEAYLMKLQSAKDIRVASRDRAMKVFDSLYKSDSEFKKSVDDRIIGMKSRTSKQRYESFNRMLVTMQGRGPDKKFYDTLKSAGYGAIQDINDMKYSGYSAKNPLIIFDEGSKNVLVRSVKELNVSSKDSAIEMMKATGETVAKEYVNKFGPVYAAGLTAATVTTYASDPNRKYNSQGGTSKWR